MHISYLAEFFLELDMFQKKVVEKNQNTHFMHNIFFPENRAFYEIMPKNMVQPDMPQVTFAAQKEMRFACWITKARKQTHTHTHALNI